MLNVTMMTDQESVLNPEDITQSGFSKLADILSEINGLKIDMM